MNRFYGSEYGVYGVAFGPDGATLSSTGRNWPFFWNVGTGRPLLRVVTQGWTQGVAFSNDGRRVAFGCPAIFDAGGLFVFRLDDDRGVRTYRGLTGVVERTWLSPTGRWVAAVAQNWQLGVWDRSTGKLAFIWDVPAGITRPVFLSMLPRAKSRSVTLTTGMQPPGDEAFSSVPV